MPVRPPVTSTPRPDGSTTGTRPVDGPDIRPGDGATPRPDVDPPRVDVDSPSGTGRPLAPEIDAGAPVIEPGAIVPGSQVTITDTQPRPTAGQGTVIPAPSSAAGQSLHDYLIKVPRLPAADANGLRTVGARHYVDVAGGVVAVSRNPDTGLYYARRLREASATGPLMMRDAQHKHWVEQQPYDWDEPTLIRHLGEQAQGLESFARTILAVSGVDANAVRRMYANNERIIPLLQDTVARWRLDREIADLSDQPNAHSKETADPLARFAERYRMATQARSAQAQVIQTRLAELPDIVAQELVAVATPVELQQIQSGTLPVRLETLGQWALQDIRLSRAYEGLYLNSVSSADTARLMLHTLDSHYVLDFAAWIDIHDGRYGGKVLISLGSPDALIRHTLVKTAAGTYQAFDGEGKPLNDAEDFYSAIMHTLGDDARHVLSIPDEAGDVGADKLSKWVRESPIPRYRLLDVLPDLPALDLATFDPTVMRLRAAAPDVDGELVRLRVVADQYSELMAVAFHPDVPESQTYHFLRGVKLLHEHFADQCVLSVYKALIDANVKSYDDNQLVVNSIEALPELQQLLPERFRQLSAELFSTEDMVSLPEHERLLAANARYLRETGRHEDYAALQLAAREGRAAPDKLSELYDEFTDNRVKVRKPTLVSAQVMDNLRMAQRAVHRAKELIPLSGNQLASIMDKGGSGIAKIKGLRGFSLQDSAAAAQLTIAEAAKGAIAIKAGNCSENSKVVFSILASEPRVSAIHIVQATRLGSQSATQDHQFVLIGDLNGKRSELVVADSWPEFPVAHLADNGIFDFKLPPIISLKPDEIDADYAFIRNVPPGPAQLPEVDEAATVQQIKRNHLDRTGYAVFVSVLEVGSTYMTHDEVPVSFEKYADPATERRFSALERLQSALGPSYQARRMVISLAG